MLWYPRKAFLWYSPHESRLPASENVWLYVRENGQNGCPKQSRIVPELEILTTFLDLTLNFVTLIGRPQWNGRFFGRRACFTCRRNLV